MRARSAAIAAETRGWTLGRDRVLWLLGALALVLAPHATRVPSWVLAAFALLGAWRLALAARPGARAPRWLFGLLGALLAAGIYLDQGTLFGRGPGIALLAVLAGMKLVEARTRRDAYVLGGLGYFLVITSFLYSQSIATGAYMLLVVVAITAALITLNVDGPHPGVLARVRLAGAMLLQAVPVMLVLFVLFPRISGPLWGLPKDAHAARSGMSETMSPGNISRLSLSDEVAFRVEFEGPPPAPGQLYWRGPVLWATDGRTWTGLPTPRSRRPLPVTALGPALDYTVTIEPHGRRWLFALDAPGAVPARASMTGDYQVLADKPVDERRRYRMRSWPRYAIGGLDPTLRVRSLELPAGAHPRARAMALLWAGEQHSPRALVERALRYFREQPFHYTLTPPLIDGDVIDGFLFSTRRGFCEYYAAAFTVLMRAAGVPARVVTGYQGGEVNALGRFMTVRQRDAHAWSEVWTDDQGWVRVDPTAAVAPERIERGMDAAIPPTIGRGALSLRPAAPVLRAWRQARQLWDALDNGWNQWVLGYGPQRQRRLLARLGLDARDYLQVGAAIGVSTLALLGAVALWLRRARHGTDPALRLYRRFCRRLERAGVARHPWEGPRDFARRASERIPALGEAIGAITEEYVRLRYGRGGDPRALRARVRRFRVRPV